MLLSVIIPTYNSERYLHRALDSVFNQTYKNIEVIIIDDCSTDDTRKIIKTYAQQHGDSVKYRFLAKNSGPAVARNVGLTMTSGSYVAFLDSDDEWAAQKIEKQLRLMEQNPAITIAGCKSQSCTPSGVMIPDRHDIPEILKDGWLKLLTLTFLCTPSVIIRADALVGEFFYTDLAVSEDREFWIRIARKGHVGMVQEILVTTYSDGNYMNKNINASITNLLPMIRFKFARYGNEIPASVRRQTLGFSYTIIAKDYGALGNFYGSLSYSIRAIFLGYRISDNINNIINSIPFVIFLKRKIKDRSH